MTTSALPVPIGWPYVWSICRQRWFEILMIAIIAHAFMQKNVVIELALNDAVPTEQVAIAPPVTGTAHNVSMSLAPVLPAEPKRVAAVAEEKTTTTESALVRAKRLAPHINNLTFVLSPTYATRHAIAQEIIDAKMAVLDEYIHTYLPVALDEMRAYAVPVSITLAQGLLESNAGASRLATQSNNHFGIKCRSKCRSCTCRNYTDDSIYDMFRVFETVGESYREHSILLSGGRYKHLKNYGIDYRKWAHGLKKAGYATDKRYAEKLITIIEGLGLDKYDRF